MMPWGMGAVMGPMMLWMLHGQLTGTAGTGGTMAALMFVGIHLVLAVALLGGALLAARLSPAARGWLSRLHRPTLRHVGVMLIAATLSAGLVHLTLHGGIA